MELRLFFCCDKVIHKKTKQIIWTGPSDIQLSNLQIDPMDILHSRSRLCFLTKQIYLKLLEEYFVKRLTPPYHHIRMHQFKMEYRDELSDIYGFTNGFTNVDIEAPSNNKHIFTKHDEDGPYAELYITITLSLHNNNNN